MPPQRLSALDASFLAVESPSAHMHVGWAATFAPPADGPAPRLRRAVRAHRRPARPRAALPPADRPRRARPERAAVDRRRGLRPRRAHPPLGRRAARGPRRRRAVGAAAARPPAVGVLDRARPRATAASGSSARPITAWSTGSPRSSSASLLLDSRAGAADGRGRRVAAGARAARARAARPRRVGPHARAAGAAARTRSSSRARRSRCPRFGLRTARALAGAVLPVAPPSALNEPGSPDRHLATARRPLDELRAIKNHHGVTVNDVAARRRRGRAAPPRRAPRGAPARPQGDGAGQRARATARGELGNRITFMFVELPASSPTRSTACSGSTDATRTRKEAGVPEDADAAMQALAYAPRTLQKAAAHALASPRVYNLVVSNIPGPRIPMYLRGCRLREALSGRPAVGPPRAVGGHDDDRRRRLLRPLRRPRDAARRRRARARPARGARRAACHHGAMADTTQTRFGLGDPVPEFALPDTDGVTHAVPQDPAPAATVLVVTCNHCPYVIAWNKRLRAAAEDYAERGVRFLGINANDAERYPADSLEAMQRFVRDQSWPYPYLLRRGPVGRPRARRRGDAARVRARRRAPARLPRRAGRRPPGREPRRRVAARGARRRAGRLGAGRDGDPRARVLGQMARLSIADV